MGRTRTVERRKEREQLKKRQRNMAILIGGVVVVVVAVLLVLLLNTPQEAPIPTEAAARYEGLQQSKSNEGFPVLGNPDAPVKVSEISSFDCPHCYDFHQDTLPGLIDRVRNNEIQLTYVPMYGTGGITNGQGAALAAVCVGEQGKFWQFHDALFTWQGTYGNTAFSQNRLTAGISNLGIDKGAWDSCMSSSLPADVLAAAVTAFNVQGVTGTPAVFVNGTLVSSPDLTTINAAIDQALAQSGGVPVVPTVEAGAEATAEATNESTTEPTTEATTEATVETTAEATTSS